MGEQVRTGLGEWVFNFGEGQRPGGGCSSRPSPFGMTCRWRSRESGVGDRVGDSTEVGAGFGQGYRGAQVYGCVHVAGLRSPAGRLVFARRPMSGRRGGSALCWTFLGGMGPQSGENAVEPLAAQGESGAKVASAGTRGLSVRFLGLNGPGVGQLRQPVRSSRRAAAYSLLDVASAA